MKQYKVTLPSGKLLSAPEGSPLLSLLQASRQDFAGFRADCGGAGICGKCRILVNGESVLACHVRVDRDMVLAADPAGFGAISGREMILTSRDGRTKADKIDGPLKIAVDIGTTTLALYLLDREGAVQDTRGRMNPQGIYGADVISRIRIAMQNKQAAEAMASMVRQEIDAAIREMAAANKASEDQIQSVTVVGNPAMQQLFMGLPLDNLVKIPYHPVITDFDTVPAGQYLDACPKAELRIVPDFSAYVGADLLAAALQAGMDRREEEAVLLVDVGTNGEMMLSAKAPDGTGKLWCCATAAGPAFEGAGIRFGMRAAEGAIDQVTLENGEFQVHVIGDEKGTQAIGLCGTGLMDAVACALQKGMINKRGKILSRTGTIPLQGEVCVTQEDVRNLQAAKAAIAAGIQLMWKEAGKPQTLKILLAGAFGSKIDPDSALRIGLLPFTEGEAPRVTEVKAIGNAAGLGAVSFEQTALSAKAEGAGSHEGTKAHEVREVAADFEQRGRQMIVQTERLELGSHPDFQRLFAKNMYFSQEEHHG